MNRLINFFISYFIVAVIPLAMYAQTFTHSISVTGITADSLYKISLTPVYKQYIRVDFHDLRLYDPQQREVPYVVLSEPMLKSNSDFVEYKILSQNHFKTYSEIVIHNVNKDQISNIAFNINNSDAYKYCSIEGSNDQKQWYSVSELQELSLLYNNTYTNQYKCIYFPLSDYAYYRLSVDDWNAHPLKINSAGYFKNSVIAGKLNDVLFSKTITQDVKQKTTTIHLQCPNNQQIDHINFSIKAPRLYKRHALIYVNRIQNIKRRTNSYKEVLYEFELSSDASSRFDIPDINEKELFIEIENKDNPPLEIEAIQCKQLASYLVCDLKKNTRYTLMCGDSLLKLPEYDLGSFVSQIPQLLPEAKLGTVNAMPSFQKTASIKEKTFFETPQFLWICLGIGAVIILLFSRSLLKDVGKQE